MTNENALAPAATGHEGLMPQEGTMQNYDTNVPQDTDTAGRAWLTDHADEVAAVRPQWATRTHAAPHGPDGFAAVTFSHVVGNRVIIDHFFEVEQGKWADIGGPSIVIPTRSVGTQSLTASQALRIAGGLIEAAMILEGRPAEDDDIAAKTTVVDLCKVAITLGLTPTQLMAARTVALRDSE